MPVPSYCPRCGGAVSVIGRSTGLCAGCGREVYANSKPAAGVLLVRGDEVLLTQRGAEPFIGTWDIPGGFLEEAESPREGAVREIREELGIALREDDLTLVLTSITPWAAGSTLDIVFEAEAPAQDPVADDDCAGWAWFPMDALPTDLPFPSTGDVLRRWLEWRAQRGS